MYYSQLFLDYPILFFIFIFTLILYYIYEFNLIYEEIQKELILLKNKNIQLIAEFHSLLK